MLYFKQSITILQFQTNTGKSMTIKLHNITAAIAVFYMQSMSAYAASFDQTEYDTLMQTANRKGFVRVQIGLNVNVSLADLGKQSPTLKLQLAEKERALLAELGDTISASGRWSNGIGQVGVYATAEGLKRIAGSSNARNFTPTVTDSMRATFYDDTNTLINDIEAEIDKNGFADVEVVMNLENVAYDYTRNGETVYKTSAEQSDEIQAKLPAFLNSLPAKHILNLADLKVKANQSVSHPTQLLRIDREGLFALQENVQIRALRLVNVPYTKTIRLDTDVLDAAKKYGSAGVMISLRQPFGYSPQIGRLPNKAWQSQIVSLQDTFNDVFSALGQDAVKDVYQFEGLPGAYARLSLAALQSIYQHPDARIQSVRLNKGVAGPLLNQSTALINMPQAWNLGYRAAGQQIVIMDSAFQKDHPFLQQPNGQSKIVYEACFGADSNVAGYQSLCPGKNPTTGDSPLGMSGSASATNCSGDSLANLCFHGTAMAGIAAGKYHWPTTNPNTPFENIELTGMAPDATIIGVSIMSKQLAGPNGLPRLWGVRTDIDKAMQTLANVGNGNAMTVSLSVGDVASAAPCETADPIFNAAVVTLNSRNIPVVAATGNDYYRNQMLWPACSPLVIKVAATIGDVDNESLWMPSNIVNPNTLPLNAPLFLAPGCTVSSTIGQEVIPATNPKTYLADSLRSYNCGTSIATPHVAGLYAAVKAASANATVQQVTEWIRDPSRAVTFPTGLGYNLPRIHVPNNP
jgi:hypothetical protein